ncbi:hypothetical protein ACF1BU_37910 [Streptomyces sp. NPDC014724]|uniref:hypothetical protein n=1 Tax=unclassified Streptomyces TaxID=2593676 RepID=UPI0036F84A8C
MSVKTGEPRAAVGGGSVDESLCVEDDWAQDHHNGELMDAAGRRLSKARLPECVAGSERLYSLIGAELGEDSKAEAVIGIETDPGP